MTLELSTYPTSPDAGVWPVTSSVAPAATPTTTTLMTSARAQRMRLTRGLGAGVCETGNGSVVVSAAGRSSSVGGDQIVVASSRACPTSVGWVGSLGCVVSVEDI